VIEFESGYQLSVWEDSLEAANSPSVLFPVLRGYVKNLSRMERFDVAIEQVLAGVESGSIRNVTLQDAKSTLSRIVDEAWEKHVSEPHFHGKQQTEDVQALYDGITIMGLHDVISASKKVAKAKATSPAVDAMRSFCVEVLPLAEAVASLKNKIVKGRALNVGPARPENPNKVVKTCPVCGRKIAVQHGTMTHHGYQRPALGWQTASCPGIRFEPLEMSSKGLEWLIDTLRKRLATIECDTPPEFLMGQRRHGLAAEQITRDNPLWARACAKYTAELESEKAAIKRELPILNKRLADWKPEMANRSSRHWS
jgi:hypothetical protein